MTFEAIIGQSFLTTHLKQGIDSGRIPHAQLFVGKQGVGALPMAIAYADYLMTHQDGGLNNMNPLTHPNIHYVYPVTTSDKVKSKPISTNYLTEWRSFIETNPYGSIHDWYDVVGVGNKQGAIGVEEANDMVSKMSLKAFNGGYKVMIVWMAEKMSTGCANKLLKLIEEPADKTVIILVTEDEEQLINTIRSRCQTVHLNLLSEDAIKNTLTSTHNVEAGLAQNIAHQSEGSYRRALDLLGQEPVDLQFETWFIAWVRTAFQAKTNKQSINHLMAWSDEISKAGREIQKQFLDYSLRFFRQALLYNYGAKDLVFMVLNDKSFKFENFAPFIDASNITEISKEIELANYHIERNANAKIVLTDLSIKLTRLLHLKKA
ncbi:MAG: DNA polymerase III subunit delta' [Flavobacteriaceae bacterium]|jgi:DNA polymerase-3 subunit delta'|nr:DNA polymerase III subunit delta' [Flavobacteriaceae bacterium]MDG1793734.1 DNA polymerase III subunit delta' [Flavobacteriaceae bacterium]